MLSGFFAFLVFGSIAIMIGAGLVAWLRAMKQQIEYGEWGFFVFFLCILIFFVGIIGYGLTI